MHTPRHHNLIIYIIGLLKTELESDVCLAVCAKTYVAYSYSDLDEINELATILSEHGFLSGDVSKVFLSKNRQKKTALKGTRNQKSISVFDFLNVILGVRRTYTTNRGIRKMQNTANMATYELEKEAIPVIDAKRIHHSPLYSKPLW